jgi:sec-independent protein translocase protein TatB
MFSFTHIAIIFVIALLVFGPEKLPEIARHIGKALGDFRRASTDFRRVIEQEFAEIERQAREKEEQERRKALEASNPAPANAHEGGAALPASGEASGAPTAQEGGIKPPLPVPNTTAQDSGHSTTSGGGVKPPLHDVHPA